MLSIKLAENYVIHSTNEPVLKCISLLPVFLMSFIFFSIVCLSSLSYANLMVSIGLANSYYRSKNHIFAAKHVPKPIKNAISRVAIEQAVTLRDKVKYTCMLRFGDQMVYASMFAQPKLIKIFGKYSSQIKMYLSLSM